MKNILFIICLLFSLLSLGCHEPEKKLINDNEITSPDSVNSNKKQDEYINEPKVTEILTEDSMSIEKEQSDKIEKASNFDLNSITWNCFKFHMSQSNIADKDLILRVLEMYSDKSKREEEILIIAETYSEIEDLLPTWICDEEAEARVDVKLLDAENVKQN